MTWALSAVERPDTSTHRLAKDVMVLVVPETGVKVQFWLLPELQLY
jgi:hypothetical protein